ncbi:adenosylcobinamide-GDP ribazoletransferase [Tsuneonella suprasediminis]|uniref:Adenosylcobinamide-GDP ribazoletransferase n=1 Tax=Tsuneonella suprasediminis TaxID=2306996 RepID=A0A419R3S2_9SPHN|nr:adenosylcobinamide-GDP ribazoletransferase [Tsuneonella suprasediminis]RJX69161.1 adenosylcobinamide-GDP ribazoletransferase [Tsuneonella suprasediminis]
MKGLIVAIQFLTRLPTPHIAVRGEEFAASIRWFPAVGLIVGTCIAAGAAAGAQIDNWTGALTALLIWVGITGALHLDGLGDIADTSGAAHKDRARLLDVLADPHVGSFAVVAIAMQLLAKLILLHGLIDAGAILPIVMIPFAARTGPLVWSRWLPDLHTGLGSRFRGAVRSGDIVLWSLALALGGFLSPSLFCVPVALFLWGWWLNRTIGGISGDGHGAGIEITESMLLFAALIWEHIR